MERRFEVALEMFTRIHAFLERAKPKASLGTVDNSMAALGEVVKRLREYQGQQATLDRATKGQTTRREEQARALLAGQLRPVARMAKALFPEDAALRHAVAPPNARTTEAMVGAAVSISTALAPHADRFAAAGLGTDFLERINTTAQELRAIITMRSTDLARRAAATEGIRQAVARGMALVKLIDAVVRLPLEGDPAQLAEWRALMRRARRGAVRVVEGGDAAGGAPVAPAPSDSLAA